jgi:hypothetical protein
MLSMGMRLKPPAVPQVVFAALVVYADVSRLNIPHPMLKKACTAASVKGFG